MDKSGLGAHTCQMPLEIHPDAPTMLIRKSAFERAGLARAHFDARYNLTPDEFRVEGEMVAIGPLYDEEGIVVADCDLRRALHAKRYFDVVGHYGRADVLAPGHPALPC